MLAGGFEVGEGGCFAFPTLPARGRGSRARCGCDRAPGACGRLPPDDSSCEGARRRVRSSGVRDLNDSSGEEAEPVSALLDVKDLRTHFMTSGAVVRAVDGVSWDVLPGETVALVGESGCGKSVSALSVMRLVAQPAGRIVGGQIVFKGRDLLGLSEEEMRRVRGKDIGMIFQEPMTSLNPVLSIGRQLTEATRDPPRKDSGPGPRARHRAALPGRHRGPRAAALPVPASVQRRNAPAHDDRHGAGVRAGFGPGRRADHRARRDHPGPDPGADEGPLAPARRGHADHHPQPGRGRPLRRSRERHVRGPDRGAGDGPGDLSPIRVILIPGASCAPSRGWTSPAGASSTRFRGSRRI